MIFAKRLFSRCGWLQVVKRRSLRNGRKMNKKKFWSVVSIGTMQKMLTRILSRIMLNNSTICMMYRRTNEGTAT